MRQGYPSLRRRIAAWLLGSLILTSAALVFDAYLAARNSVFNLHDRVMVSLASNISDHMAGYGGEQGPKVALDLITAAINERIYYQVLSADGRTLGGRDDLPPPKAEDGRELAGAQFYPAQFDGRKFRILSVVFPIAGEADAPFLTVRVAQTVTERERLVHEATLESALRIALIVGMAALVAWLGVLSGLKPLKNLERAISQRSFDDLRPIDRVMPQEIRHVVAAINHLLARLSTSIDAYRSFVGNAAHQLRTPITTLIAQAEMAKRASNSDIDRDTIDGILRSTRKASRLVDQLLTLARAEPAHLIRGRRDRVDLVALAADQTREWVPKALERNVDLGFESAQASLIVLANEVLLGEMLANLIDNAIRYGRDGGQITVRVMAGQDAILEVEDDGPGIPVERRPQAVERFVRLDERLGDGCGLGLAIARDVTVGHGGRFELLDGTNGQGLLVRISLPLKPKEAD